MKITGPNPADEVAEMDSEPTESSIENEIIVDSSGILSEEKFHLK